jgi:hypothetical protein
MKKKMAARFAMAIAATLVVALSCYGLARGYLYYEAARAELMMRELGDIKVGDPESEALPILKRYGNYRKAPEDLAKFDKADYEYEAEIGPSGIYYFIDRGSTGVFCRMTRAVLNGLNPRLRRAIGLRRWSVDGRVGIKENSVTIVRGMVLAEGSHEWLAGEWTLAQVIPPYEIKRLVTSMGVSWPHDVNHYLVRWGRLVAMEKQNGGGEGTDTWITPDATDEEKRSAHEFRWQCLTSPAGCRTVCDLDPAAVEYADSGTWEGRKEACAAPSARNSYW